MEFGGWVALIQGWRFLNFQHFQLHNFSKLTFHQQHKQHSNFISIICGVFLFLDVGVGIYSKLDDY